MDANGPDISRVTRSREQAEASYSRLSRWYDLLANSSERKARELGLRMLGARDGEIVLEIGSGSGHGLVALARSVGPSGRVHGIDLSPGMLGIAEARVRSAGLADRVDLRRGDATMLPFEDGFFDAVFMSFVLELFDTPEIPMVLGECRRVLRPGGRLSVVALSRKGKPGLALKLYEWAHRTFPALCDCRPIYPQRSLVNAGFQLLAMAEESMWGLPVEVILARKG